MNQDIVLRQILGTDISAAALDFVHTLRTDTELTFLMPKAKPEDADDRRPIIRMPSAALDDVQVRATAAFVTEIVDVAWSVGKPHVGTEGPLAAVNYGLKNMSATAGHAYDRRHLGVAVRRFEMGLAPAAMVGDIPMYARVDDTTWRDRYFTVACAAAKLVAALIEEHAPSPAAG